MTFRMTRRVRRYILAVTGIVVLALGLRAFWLEPASLVVVEQHLDIPWPAQRPLRIAVLTDLHVGSPFNGLDKLRAVVARTNAARPDVVCILGDLVIQGVTGGRFVPPEAIAVELASLRAPAGVLAVLGNHDAWLDHDRVRRAVEHAGIRVVEDTAVRVDTPAGPVWVAGVSDLWTRPHDIKAALAGSAGRWGSRSPAHPQSGHLSRYSGSRDADARGPYARRPGALPASGGPDRAVDVSSAFRRGPCGRGGPASFRRDRHRDEHIPRPLQGPSSRDRADGGPASAGRFEGGRPATARSRRSAHGTLRARRRTAPDALIK